MYWGERHGREGKAWKGGEGKVYRGRYDSIILLSLIYELPEDTLY